MCDLEGPNRHFTGTSKESLTRRIEKKVRTVKGGRRVRPVFLGAADAVSSCWRLKGWGGGGGGLRSTEEKGHSLRTS